MSWGLRTVPVLALAAVLSACGSAGQPRAYPEQGVDGLQVPTPTLDPAAYAAEVDNPWLPAGDQDRWTYEVEVGGTVAATARVRAERGDDDAVAGAPVTWLSTTLQVRRGGLAGLAPDGGRLPAGTYEWRDAVAQDLAGNVWWLARDARTGAWSAGGPDELAGLLAPAGPRVGDAYEHRVAPGLPEAWSRVEHDDVQQQVSGRTLGSLLQTRGPGYPSPLEVPGSTSTTEARRWFAPGLGLVREERAGTVLELVEPSPAGE